MIVAPSSPENRLTFSLGAGIRAEDIRFKREGADLDLKLGQGSMVRLPGWYGLDPAERPELTLQVIGKEVWRYAPGAVVNALASGKEVKAQAWLDTGILAQDASGKPQVIGGGIAWSYAKEGNLDALSAEALQSWLGAPDFGGPQSVDPALIPAPDSGGHDEDSGRWGPGAAPGTPAAHAGKDDAGERDDSASSDDSSAAPEDSGSRLEEEIRAWFEEKSLSERLAPFSELNQEAWPEDAPREYGRDYRAQWERMEARLNQHLEGTRDGAELGSEFGAGFRPFMLFSTSNAQVLQLSAGDARQMPVFTGIKEGLRTL